MKRFLIPAVLVAWSLLPSCVNDEVENPCRQWILVDTIFTSRPDHPLDKVAVKDPSIVFYKEQYHLFYTAKSVEDSNYNISCAYAHAPALEGLNSARRFNLDSLAGRDVIAPQVFFFEPRKLWYLIAHTSVRDGNLNRLEPIYMTNPDIEDSGGWSEARVLKTGRSNDDFWIDFWVICNDHKAYMFYGDQRGAVLRVECPLNQFPEGFAQSTPEIALSQRGELPRPWRMFEAVHIYHVKSDQKYLALLEGAYEQSSLEGEVDSRNRFIFGMLADSLNGEWRRIEPGDDEFLADAKNLYFRDGSSTALTQVSHPELIRSGFNQKLEIDDYKLSLLFQSFDGSRIPDSYKYNELPWNIMLMRNFSY